MAIDKLKISCVDKPTSFIYVDFNPTSLKHSFSNRYDTKVAVSSLGGELEYINSSVDEISMTLLFDGTGVDDFGAVHAFNQITGKSDVKEKIDDFLKITTIPSGDIHQPNTLSLIWGGLNFKCKLISVDINYKLFDHFGDPLRAEVNTRFRKYLSAEEWKKTFDKKSPDVTHQRILKAGETLPMLCHEIYGNPKLYVDVARANRICNFREISPGSKIVFPPLV